MTTPKYTLATIGEISSGTLRPEDLLGAFLFALEDLKSPHAGRFNANLISYGFGYSQCGVCGMGNREDWPDGFDDDTAEEIIGEMADALNDHAPPYCYFGAHEGDGACFGFWPDLESCRESVEFVGDFDAPEDGFTGEWLHVSDHGNATLYVRDIDGNDNEVWSIA